MAEVEELQSKRLSAEEQYFYERSYQEPAEGAGRIEEAAKSLATATAAVSGLFLSAFKLTLGDDKPEGLAWLVPFVFWTLSFAALIFVLLPQRYPAGKSEPDAWRRAFEEARDRKYRRLVWGAALLMAGIVSGVWTLFQ